MRQIILDTETTGLDPKMGHKIIEIGGVEIIDRIRTGNFFHFYINPERNVPDDAFKIHGISTQFLQDKPKFREIANDFVSFIGNDDLIIHNAAFDLKFINHELESINMRPIISNKIIDTLLLARKKFPGSPASLNALCKRFNIDLNQRNASGHGALLDSELLYKVYICLEEGLQSELLLASAVATNKVNKVTREKLEKKFIADRNFEYKEDFDLHKEFIKGIKTSLWDA